MWHFEPLPLSGSFLITLPKFDDNRGCFVKTFHTNMFLEHQLAFELKESYFSISNKNVLRGMNFQNPPHDHAKVVCCPAGKILDVILDIRKESATYGQFYAVELSAVNHQALYIPKGFAHGFRSLEDGSMTQYLVSSEHNASADAGILYNSFGMEWGIDNPIMSARDQSFETFTAFQSMF